MLEVLYGLIAMCSTTVGAMTGMGGGVIIKPVMDLFGHFNPMSINMVASLTVLVMAVVSVIEMLAGKTPFDFKVAVPLAASSLLGGHTGKAGLSWVIGAMNDGNRVLVVQNIVLACLIIPIIYFMRRKKNMPNLGFSGWPPALAVGFSLGVFSAFLGIGGGPFNVVGIIMVFGVSTKMAAAYSLFIILFSQAASAAMTGFSTGFGAYDLSMLPVMMFGAMAGGFLGARLRRHLTTERVETMFNLVQIAVLFLCIVNIIHNW